MLLLHRELSQVRFIVVLEWITLRVPWPLVNYLSNSKVQL